MSLHSIQPYTAERRQSLLWFILMLCVIVFGGATSCTTGRVYTSQGSLNGFSYSLPETVITIDIPVRFWVLGHKDQKGNLVVAPGAPRGYLDIDPSTASTPISLEMEAYPADLSISVLDQANNATSLNKFEVAYHTSGSDAALRSSGILKSINSDSADKTGEIIKNFTDTAIQLGKLALNAKGILQAAGEEGPVVILQDRIQVSMPLRKGYESINKRLSEELARIKVAISLTEDGKNLGDNLLGITDVSLAGKTKGWADRNYLQFIGEKIVKDSNGAIEGAIVNRNHVTLVNGVVYVDAQRADFDLIIESKDRAPGIGGKNEQRSKIIRFSGQIPEAGKLKVLPVNPKLFGNRAITTEFARNGKLTKWSYTAGSRAEKISAFSKEESTALNTGLTDLLTKNRQNDVDMATRRANVDKLEGLILTKQGELDLARSIQTAALASEKSASEAYNSVLGDPKANDKDKAAALQLKNAAEQSRISADNKVKAAEFELNALIRKKGDVEKGLLTP